MATRRGRRASADDARIRGGAVDRARSHQPADRRRADHQRAHRRHSRSEHPGQTGTGIARAGGRVDRGAASSCVCRPARWPAIAGDCPRRAAQTRGERGVIHAAPVRFVPGGADSVSVLVVAPPVIADGHVVLSGPIKNLGLERLIRFVGSLQHTGELALTDGQSSGGLGFEAGRVVGTWYGTERGLPALEAIVLALADADFSLTVGLPGERNVDLDEDQFVDHFQQMTARRENVLAAIPSPAVVPRIVDGPHGGQRLVVDVSTLRMLVAVDGHRCVEELADGRGLARTMHGLAVLGTLFGGEFADRLGRRPTIIGSMACAAVLTVAVSFLATPHTYVALLVVVAGAGAMAQSCRTAAAALLSDLTPPGRRVMLFS